MPAVSNQLDYVLRRCKVSFLLTDWNKAGINFFATEQSEILYNPRVMAPVLSSLIYNTGNLLYNKKHILRIVTFCNFLFVFGASQALWLWFKPTAAWKMKYNLKIP